jgi:hypothetical protein
VDLKIEGLISWRMCCGRVEGQCKGLQEFLRDKRFNCVDLKFLGS